MEKGRTDSEFMVWRAPFQFRAMDGPFTCHAHGQMYPQPPRSAHTGHKLRSVITRASITRRSGVSRNFFGPKGRVALILSRERPALRRVRERLALVTQDNLPGGDSDRRGGGLVRSGARSQAE